MEWGVMRDSYHIARVGNVYLVVRNAGGGIVAQFKKKSEAEAHLYSLLREGER